MADPVHHDDDRLVFERNIEGDSAPMQRTLMKPIDKSDGLCHEDLYDVDPRYRDRKEQVRYDSDLSTDSGIGSIRSKSTLPSVTLSSATSGISEANTCSFSQSNDGSNLSSQFSHLKLSDTTSGNICTSDVLQIGAKLDSDSDKKHADNTLNANFSSSKLSLQECNKEAYSEGLKLTDEAFKVNQDGDMSLHLSIIFMNTEVALLLASLLSVEWLNHLNKLLQTPLHLSVLTHQPRISRALLMAGASLEVPDRNGNTALHLACMHNYLDCVGALTHRVSVDEFTQFFGDKRSLKLPQTPQSLELKNYEGYTCIHIATFNKNMDLLAYLVNLGANINAADDKSGRRPLHYAVEAGNVELASLMIKRLGANVNSTTFDLNTPLHLAAGRDLHQLVHLLLEAGASRHAVNCEGLTPHQVSKSDKMRAALQTVEYSDFTIAGV